MFPSNFHFLRFAQKGNFQCVKFFLTDRQTEEQADRPTDGPTNLPIEAPFLELENFNCSFFCLSFIPQVVLQYLQLL